MSPLVNFSNRCTYKLVVAFLSIYGEWRSHKGFIEERLGKL